MKAKNKLDRSKKQLPAAKSKASKARPAAKSAKPAKAMKSKPAGAKSKSAKPAAKKSAAKMPRKAPKALAKGRVTSADRKPARKAKPRKSAMSSERLRRHLENDRKELAEHHRTDEAEANDPGGRTEAIALNDLPPTADDTAMERVTARKR